MMKFEAQVRARSAEISDLTERVGDFLHRGGVDARATHHVAMILEELLTNLGAHGGVVDGPATVRILIEFGRVLVEIIDSGPPFDPRSTPDPDLEGPAEDRIIGGLGLFLMRKFASAVEYSRSDELNRTSFTVVRS
jgi:anti-sigma regulatory factor (Ser/Thr protein kinase)